MKTARACLPDARDNLRRAYGVAAALLLAGLAFEWVLIGAIS